MCNIAVRDHKEVLPDHFINHIHCFAFYTVLIICIFNYLCIQLLGCIIYPCYPVTYLGQQNIYFVLWCTVYETFNCFMVTDAIEFSIIEEFFLSRGKIYDYCIKPLVKNRVVEILACSCHWILFLMQLTRIGITIFVLGLKGLINKRIN